MEKSEHDDFTLGFDGKDDGGAYTGDVLEKKVESLGWKVTLLTIIVPCLIAIIVIMAYFGITKKVADFQDTGSAEVRQLTDIYEEKLSTIRRSQEKWQADATAERADIRKRTSDFEKKAAAGLQAVEKKADQAARSLEDLRRDVERLDGRTATADKKAATVAESVEALRGDFKLIKTAIDSLKAEKVDQAALDRRLAEMNERRDKAIQSVRSECEARAEALLKRLDAMEKAAKSDAPPTDGSFPGDKNIVEQDLLP